MVQRVLVDRLMTLAGGRARRRRSRAIASRGARENPERSRALAGGSAHDALLAADITRFLERPYEPAKPIPAPAAPPGAPIGDSDQWWLDASPAAGSAWWQWLTDELRIEKEQ